MPHLLKRIPENQRKHLTGLLRLATAEMEPGRKKGKKSYFGYKLHQKSDIDYGLIREIETTTAKVHDSRVDLSIEGEVVIRDGDISVCLPEVMTLPWCAGQLMRLWESLIKKGIG